MSESLRKAILQAKPSHGYEFGGPVGAFATSLGLPLLCYLACFFCNDVSGCPIPSSLHPASLTLEKIKKETGWPGLLGLGSIRVTFYTLEYYFLSMILQAILPGKEVEGTELRSGARLKYKFNAFGSAIVILSIAAIGTLFAGDEFLLWTFIWDNYTQLLTANLAIAFSLAWFVYVRSFSVKAGNHHRRELAVGGHSGSLIYDWFIGRELNPRITIPLIGEIDIKAFCEVRPGLLGWLLLDFAFMVHQHRLWGYVSDSMFLVVGFQTFYVLDSLWMEPAITTQMDITTDGFGFMLAFGDLAWLPFIYSLQARYLAIYPVKLGYVGVVGTLAVQALGFYIFRASNNEKDRFRRNPKDPRVAHLKSLKTKSGSNLLISGWWGTSRHINYFGDWIMAWSYCLPTAIAGYRIQSGYPFATPGAKVPKQGDLLRAGLIKPEIVQAEAMGWGMVITYFYLVYFAVLLVHRGMRDDEKCSRKYGQDWEEYKKKVPKRIVPYIY